MERRLSEKWNSYAEYDVGADIGAHLFSGRRNKFSGVREPRGRIRKGGSKRSAWEGFAVLQGSFAGRKYRIQKDMVSADIGNDGIPFYAGGAVSGDGLKKIRGDHSGTLCHHAEESKSFLVF